MSLQLTGTWEHALLAVTAQEATRAGESGDLGRTALQNEEGFIRSAYPARTCTLQRASTSDKVH
jgi:hypothetical protein